MAKVSAVAAAICVAFLPEMVNAEAAQTLGRVGLVTVIEAILALVATSPAPALEGATESIPKPREATATSATRLKVVFVDICFLSISRDQEFPALGFG